MALALADDLRRRVVAAVDDGMSRRAAAVRFGIAPSTAIKWRQQWRRTGTIEPRPRGGDKRSHRLESHAAEILARVEATLDITLAEIVAHLEQTHGLAVAPSTVWRRLDRHGLGFKKTAHAAGQQRPEVWQRRLAWSRLNPSASSSRRRPPAALPSGIGSGAC